MSDTDGKDTLLSEFNRIMVAVGKYAVVEANGNVTMAVASQIAAGAYVLGVSQNVPLHVALEVFLQQYQYGLEDGKKLDQEPPVKGESELFNKIKQKLN